MVKAHTDYILKGCQARHRFFMPHIPGRTASPVIHDHHKIIVGPVSRTAGIAVALGIGVGLKVHQANGLHMRKQLKHPVNILTQNILPEPDAVFQKQRSADAFVAGGSKGLSVADQILINLFQLQHLVRLFEGRFGIALP